MTVNHDWHSLNGVGVTGTRPSKCGAALDQTPTYNSKQRLSISSKTARSVHSTKSSHQEYLDSLVLPSKEEVQRISAIQEKREEEIIRQRLSLDSPAGMDENERARAAGLIQRNFRGYKERRQIEGKGLDADSRWGEALKEARYRNAIRTRPESSEAAEIFGADCKFDHQAANKPRRSSNALQNWRKVGTIARRAVADEDSDVETEDDALPGDATAEQREHHHARREEMRLERRKAAKMMDLQYWLESVDQKHRYGSNLRTYHQEWLKADTHQNFFLWLDEGEGRFIDCAGCPRERLDRERVRYLSREERLDYLVKINHDGLLCWAKNGELIDTTVKYKDSIRGIVPDNDPTPAFTYPAAEAATGLQDHDASTSDSSLSSYSDQDDAATDRRANKYTTPELDRADGVKKVRHITAATVFTKLLRSSVKKNTWIYVADTSFRLYVGIKQSGAFQHSSFLHGSRISSAGLIKVHNGKLDKLSPLSGHYRPTTTSFRTFVQCLKEEGVDMHHVSISRSYAVLVGLETYVKSRKRGKRFVKKLVHGRDKILSPEELQQREEEQMDKSESAARERRILDM